MIELCDWNKVESEEYKRINAGIQKTVGQIGTATGKTLTPGDHYLFDYAYIISQIKKFKGLRFLDLGSACSPLSVYIAQQGGIVTTIDLPGRPDFAAYFATLKKELGIQITYLGLDFCSDPLPKADVIISCSAVEHNKYQKIHQLVKNARIALPPGGQFIFTVIAEPEPPEKKYEEYCSYREDKIRRTFLQGFDLDKEQSNFPEFDTLYQRFRKQFPKYFYIPVGVSLRRERQDGNTNIVVVSCGRPHTLNACLSAIVRNTKIPYYVTIVNNTFPHWKEAMQKYYTAWLQKHPDWKLVDGTDNFILEAKNNGIKARPDAKYHVDIDDDIFVTTEWLLRMTQGLDEHPEYAIVVPLLNFIPGYIWPEQVAWLPQKIQNSLHFNSLYGGKFIENMSKYHERALLPDKNVFKIVRTFEFSCVLKRPGWLWDAKLDRGRCGWAGTLDFTLRAEEKGLKIAVCRSVVLFHALKASLSWDPRFREDIPAHYWEQKWGDKTKSLPGPYGVPVVTQMAYARQNMLKGAPEEE